MAKPKLQQGINDVDSANTKPRMQLFGAPEVIVDHEIPTNILTKMWTRKITAFATFLAIFTALLYSTLSATLLFVAVSDNGLITVARTTPTGGVYEKGSTVYISGNTKDKKEFFTNVINGFGMVPSPALVKVYSGNFDLIQRNSETGNIEVLTVEGEVLEPTKTFPAAEEIETKLRLNDQYIVECLYSMGNVCTKGELFLVPAEYIYGVVKNYGGSN